MTNALERLPHPQVLTGFGNAVRASCRYAEPTSIEELVALIAHAKQTNMTVAFRGTGNSYGDAALNAGGLVIGMARMNRVLSWDPSTGEFDAEAGCTIEDVWRATISDGYWPPVVPGTMRPTLAGCAAMNIHGKNNFKVGTFGEHIIDLDLLTANGELQTLSATKQPALFRAVVGGMGLLGAITRVKLRLARVPSGNVEVMPIIARNLDELFSRFATRLATSDYLVAWVDCFAKTSSLGRGLIHAANYATPDHESRALVTRTNNLRGLPRRIFGFPKAQLWRVMRPFTNKWFMPWVNAAKYWSAYLGSRWRARRYQQSLVEFIFLLDYVAHWERAYGPDGLIQYQLFVPDQNAKACMREVLTTCQKAKMVPFLGVLKRHRPDNALLSHGVDGWSLALDFKVTKRKRDDLWKLTTELTAIVIAHGGRFYFAKDAVLRPSDVQVTLGDETIDQLRAHKALVDPTNVFANDLFQRAIAPVIANKNSP